jgi:hypothetical protein
VPAFWKVNENLPPDAIATESQPAPSDVDVCATESVFVQVTVVPAATFNSAGAYARFPRVDAFDGMLTAAVVRLGGGAGVGDGVVGDGAAG